MKKKALNNFTKGVSLQPNLKSTKSILQYCPQ